MTAMYPTSSRVRLRSTLALAAALTLLGQSCNRTPDEVDEFGPPQILFGDLHVHSTNSVDVLVLQAPILGGRGIVTPSDHCDFAKYCSQLDFWAITDHQESAPIEAWADSREAVRECNSMHGGYKKNPEMVTFAGFEWQQSAESPESNWGHKNVIFRDDAIGELPDRAIASVGQVTGVSQAELDLVVALAKRRDPSNTDVYNAISSTVTAGFNTTACDEGVPTLELPDTCVEYAADPQTLYSKLDEGGYETLVIPHGMTWGAHHGPLTSWEHQLNPAQHDPNYQTLLEIYSGHGNMEEYRDWLPVEVGEDGALSCPAPSEGYLPCCWRAGQLVLEQHPTCQEDPTSPSCEAQVASARQSFVDAGRKGFSSVKGATPLDWLDCGECRDCFQAAEGHRPLGSAQAALARTFFDNDGQALRYQMGFLGSTDTHAIGPGAGYKEDRWMSDIFGSADPDFDQLVDLMVPRLFPDWIRQNSYYYSGGLVAVHAENRSRDAIWEAILARQVYATTGERIMLWFDLTNGPNDERMPMGTVTDLSHNPTFEVRALGSFVQSPGCPTDKVIDSGGLVDQVCHGECYNPTTERRVISRVEIVKITPQITSDEAIGPLISDPWRTFDCPASPQGCSFTFEDDEYLTDGRPALYYAKVFQQPSAQLNGDNLRCDWIDGECVATRPCLGGYQGEGDDCKDLNEEAAWASPIYLSP